MVFLTINAFVFLVPMMSEILALAKSSLHSSQLPEEFYEKI